MTVFYSIIVLTTLAVCVILGMAVNRALKHPPLAADAKSLYEHRRQELNKDVDDGVLAENDLASAEIDIAHALLDEDNVEINRAQSASITTIVFLFVTVPLIAIATYLTVGAPRLVEPTSEAPVDDVTPAQVETMIAALQERLDADQTSAEGWLLLARSLMALGRYDEAVTAMAKTNELVPGNVSVLLQYADAIAMADGGTLNADAMRLINQALELEPNNATALWLSGLGAAEAGDRERALELMRRAKAQMAASAQPTGEVDAIITALEASTSTTTQSVAQVSMLVSIRIDQTLAAAVDDEDTVFVFARQIDEAGPPLAVTRVKVKHLTDGIKLDDTMAMGAGPRLTVDQTVIVTARVAKQGSPLPQPGDLEGRSAPVTVATTNAVEIVIDSQIE